MLIDGEHHALTRHHRDDLAEVVQSVEGSALVYRKDVDYAAIHAETYGVAELHAVSHIDARNRMEWAEGYYCRGVLVYAVWVPRFPAALAEHARNLRLPILTAVSAAEGREAPTWRFTDAETDGQVARYRAPLSDGGEAAVLVVEGLRQNTTCIVARSGEGPWIAQLCTNGHAQDLSDRLVRIVAAAHTVQLAEAAHTLAPSTLAALDPVRDNPLVTDVLAGV